MKLKKQFSEFYDEIRIKDESQKLKDKREILQNYQGAQIRTE